MQRLKELMEAAERGDLAVAMRLAPDIDLEQSTRLDGLGPIALAAQNGHVDCLLGLLRVAGGRAQSQVDLAVGEAAESGHPECLRLLLEQSLGRAFGPRGSEPIHRAAAGSGPAHGRCVEILLEAVSPDARDKEGATPLRYAAATGSPAAVEALLGAGADPDARDAIGRAPLLAAAQRVDADAIGVLAALLAAADPNVPANDGTTPLMAAAKRSPGGASAMELLLARGADPLRVDAKGRDALMHSILSGDVEGAMLLVGKSDLDRSDDVGLTALDLARAAQPAGMRDVGQAIDGARKARIERDAIERSSASAELPRRPSALRV